MRPGCNEAGSGAKVIYPAMFGVFVNSFFRWGVPLAI